MYGWKAPAVVDLGPHLAPVRIRQAAIDGLPGKVPAVTENWTTPRYHGTVGTLAETKRPRFPCPRLRSHGIKGCLTGTPLTHRRLYLAVFSGLPFPFRQRRLVQPGADLVRGPCQRAGVASVADGLDAGAVSPAYCAHPPSGVLPPHLVRRPHGVSPASMPSAHSSPPLALARVGRQMRAVQWIRYLHVAEWACDR